MATTPVRAEEKARKVRSLLASYYNVEDGVEASTPERSAPSASASSAASSPSRAADPEVALRRLLTTAPLAELVNRAGAVSSEVAALDSDMQMLVYENYNKFIVATDTMRAMGGCLDGMDAKLQRLQGLLGSVLERSDQVAGRLDVRQRQIEDLSATRYLLRRLQAVFELPKRIRTALDVGSLEVAVDAAADVAPLLAGHGHKASIKALVQVSGEIGMLTREILRRLQARMDVDPSAARECIEQMRRLGRPHDELRNAYLGCARGQLDAVLDDSESALLGGACAEYKTLFPDDSGKPLFAMLRAALARYLSLTRRALRAAAALAAAEAAGITLAGGLATDVAQLLDEPRGMAAAAALRELAQGDRAVRWGVDDVVRGLYVVRNDVLRLEGPAPDLGPRDRSMELTEHVIRQHLGLCFAAVESGARALLADAVGAITTAAQANDAARLLACMSSAAALVREWVCQRLHSLLSSLATYREQDWVQAVWRGIFADALAGRLRHCIGLFAEEAAALAGLELPAAGTSPAGAGGSPASRSRSPSPPPRTGMSRGSAAGEPASGPAYAAAARRTASLPMEGAPPPVLAFLAGVCSALAAPTALAPALACLDAMDGPRGGGNGAASTAVGKPNTARQSPARDIETTLRAAEGALFEAYTAAQGARLELATASLSAAGDLANAWEPRRPRELAVLLLDTLAEVGAQVRAAGAGGPDEAAPDWDLNSNRGSSSAASSVRGGMTGTGPAPLPPRHRPAPSNDAQALGAALGRMFAAPGPGNGGGGWGAADACGRVALVGLRAMATALAGTTLSRPAFQQVQLDCHFMRGAVQAAVAGSYEEPVVLQALDEVLAVAMERCPEPTLLEPVVLDRILSGTSRYL